MGELKEENQIFWSGMIVRELSSVHIMVLESGLWELFSLILPRAGSWLPAMNPKSNFGT